MPLLEIKEGYQTNWLELLMVALKTPEKDILRFNMKELTNLSIQELEVIRMYLACFEPSIKVVPVKTVEKLMIVIISKIIALEDTNTITTILITGVPYKDIEVHLIIYFMTTSKIGRHILSNELEFLISSYAKQN